MRRAKKATVKYRKDISTQQPDETSSAGLRTESYSASGTTEAVSKKATEETTAFVSEISQMQTEKPPSSTVTIGIRKSTTEQTASSKTKYTETPEEFTSEITSLQQTTTPEGTTQSTTSSKPEIAKPVMTTDSQHLSSEKTTISDLMQEISTEISKEISTPVSTEESNKFASSLEQTTKFSTETSTYQLLEKTSQFVSQETAEPEVPQTGISEFTKDKSTVASEVSLGMETTEATKPSSAGKVTIVEDMTRKITEPVSTTESLRTISESMKEVASKYNTEKSTEITIEVTSKFSSSLDQTVAKESFTVSGSTKSATEMGVEQSTESSTLRTSQAGLVSYESTEAVTSGTSESSESTEQPIMYSGFTTERTGSTFSPTGESATEQTTAYTPEIAQPHLTTMKDTLSSASVTESIVESTSESDMHTTQMVTEMSNKFSSSLGQITPIVFSGTEAHVSDQTADLMSQEPTRQPDYTTAYTKEPHAVSKETNIVETTEETTTATEVNKFASEITSAEMAPSSTESATGRETVSCISEYTCQEQTTEPVARTAMSEATQNSDTLTDMTSHQGTTAQQPTIVETITQATILQEESTTEGQLTMGITSEIGKPKAQTNESVSESTEMVSKPDLTSEIAASTIFDRTKETTEQPSSSETDIAKAQTHQTTESINTITNPEGKLGTAAASLMTTGEYKVTSRKSSTIPQEEITILTNTEHVSEKTTESTAAFTGPETTTSIRLVEDTTEQSTHSIAEVTSITGKVQSTIEQSTIPVTTGLKEITSESPTQQTSGLTKEVEIPVLSTGLPTVTEIVTTLETSAATQTESKQISMSTGRLGLTTRKDIQTVSINTEISTKAFAKRFTSTAEMPEPIMITELKTRGKTEATTIVPTQETTIEYNQQISTSQSEEETSSVGGQTTDRNSSFGATKAESRKETDETTEFVSEFTTAATIGEGTSESLPATTRNEDVSFESSTATPSPAKETIETTSTETTTIELTNEATLGTQKETKGTSIFTGSVSQTTGQEVATSVFPTSSKVPKQISSEEPFSEPIASTVAREQSTLTFDSVSSKIENPETTTQSSSPATEKTTPTSDETTLKIEKPELTTGAQPTESKQEYLTEIITEETTPFTSNLGPSTESATQSVKSNTSGGKYGTEKRSHNCDQHRAKK